MSPLPDPLGVTERVALGRESETVYRLDRIPGVDAQKLHARPRTVRILLENLLRRFDPKRTGLAVVQALAEGRPLPHGAEIPFYPGRVLLQDFTGIPVLVDLTTMRSAAAAAGLGAGSINPVVPVDLIVDHSVQVDSFGSPRSITINLDREYERNSERYQFLRWARSAYRDLTIVPPGNGICHQVNLEYLSKVVSARGVGAEAVAYPDTLIGTDSHTTMVNGVSVLSWGVGGIEAEAVMLGEPYFLADPEVVGVELTGRLAEGVTATDLVLTITHRLREKGVVDKFVEFVGPGVSELSVPDRATISNMCPEYGATAAFFPIDEATTTYLRGTGRDANHIARVESYARLQGLWGSRPAGELDFDETVTVDLGAIVPTLAGPKNPSESVPLPEVPASFEKALSAYRQLNPAPPNGASHPVRDGDIVIAAITSCTNTSNPAVMVGAGLIAQRALALGMKVPVHVKTSLAPGSKVVTAYLERAGLLAPLAKLGFDVVGYGCTTCIGNSGPLPDPIAKEIRERDTFVAAVLSGNRNFEGRIHNQVRASYLASPMLVVCYALAGRMDLDLAHDPIGVGAGPNPIFLKDLWPRSEEIRRLVGADLRSEMFEEKYREIEVGDPHWEALPPVSGEIYPWDPKSTYLEEAPFLHLPPPLGANGAALVEGARALAVLGDQISTDHISPAGAIADGSPAAVFLRSRGVPSSEFNTYGSRRGDHEVLVRGTFANLRLKNQLVAPTEGGYTLDLASGETVSIFDAAERYRAARTPLLILAGKNFGQGSSRDWAAKGPRLLGVGAIIVESFERIIRSNLIEMGVLPLLFPEGHGWKALGLTGRERFALRLPEGQALAVRGPVDLVATRPDGSEVTVRLTVAIHSEIELDYYRAGGVLPYVMRTRFAAG
ncbi:MAG: aconitate hydratase AcnA [Thermoplasmata archaeon]